MSSSNRHLIERSLFRSRIAWMILFISVGLIALFARAAYLQVWAHQQYQLLADNNRVRIEVDPPVRGRILDRNGILLAENHQIFALQTPARPLPKIEEELQQLKQLLPNIDQAQWDSIEQRLKYRPSYRSIYVLNSLSKEEAYTFAAHAYAYEDIELVTRTLRHYPHGKITAEVLGYVGPLSEENKAEVDAEIYRDTKVIGKLGLEKTYENRLHGLPGLVTYEVNSRGKIIRTLEQSPPVSGEDLHLALDVDLQQFAHTLLDGRRGAIVAIDPSDGGVLALVSSPSYDANLYVDGISNQAYQALLDNPDRPLLNRATAGQYPPGSTIKPFIGLGGLEQGVITSKTTIVDPGYFEFQGRKYRDWKRGGHGVVNVKRSIESSVDTFYYDLALKMDIDGIVAALDPFGFGQTTQIDLSHESSGNLPTPAWKKAKYGAIWYPGETIITGIGQGFMLATPLQLARATAILANRGQAVTPHLVIPKEQTPVAQIPIKNRKNWEEIIDGMVKVMTGSRGTARNLGKNLKFSIAGKTGTAQVFSLDPEEEYDAEKIDPKLRDHALFIAFAPVNNPKIALAVVVENGGSGSSTAAPLGVRLVEHYLSKIKTP